MVCALLDSALGCATHTTLSAGSGYTSIEIKVNYLASGDSGLAVVSTLRANQSIQASLVNAGVLTHPAAHVPVLGFVTYGRVKLTNLRSRPQLALTFRKGWQWATVEGTAELAGPVDTPEWLHDSDQLRLLLREVFTACGGTHDDWPEYDRVMAEQGRTVVLVTPTRVYGNLPA